MHSERRTPGSVRTHSRNQPGAASRLRLRTATPLVTGTMERSPTRVCSEGPVVSVARPGWSAPMGPHSVFGDPRAAPIVQSQSTPQAS